MSWWMHPKSFVFSFVDQTQQHKWGSPDHSSFREVILSTLGAVNNYFAVIYDSSAICSQSRDGFRLCAHSSSTAADAITKVPKQKNPSGQPSLSHKHDAVRYWSFSHLVITEPTQSGSRGMEWKKPSPGIVDDSSYSGREILCLLISPSPSNKKAILDSEWMNSSTIWHLSLELFDFRWKL